MNLYAYVYRHVHVVMHVHKALYICMSIATLPYLKFKTRLSQHLNQCNTWSRTQWSQEKGRQGAIAPLPSPLPKGKKLHHKAVYHAKESDKIILKTTTRQGMQKHRTMQSRNIKIRLFSLVTSITNTLWSYIDNLVVWITLVKINEAVPQHWPGR